MTYKQVKAAVKNLIIEKGGFSNILGGDLVVFYRQGASATDVQNALSYFKYSPQATAFRNSLGI